MVRSRWSIVAVVLLLSLGLVGVSGSVPAAASGRVLAQDVGEGEDSQDGQPGEEQPSGEEQAEEGASEAGPPWTYQMAWMGLALGFVVMALLGFLYWRMVVRRARGTA